LSYVRAGAATTLNAVLNAATLGRFVWLEGRVRRGVFRNWARRFAYRPTTFALPQTEEEIVALIKRSRTLRVFGSAHSFNDGVVTKGRLVSLDRFTGAVTDGGAGEESRRERNQLAVKGGTRVRDVVKLLRERGLAFPALPSHDAQSIAGILSTDVHGTGTDWGFVSDSVVALTVLDGKGQRHECTPTDDLFKAAIGGVGAVGILTEAVVQGVPRFDVEQRVSIEDLSCVERDFDRLLDKHDHLSLYLFPFSGKCQVNTWDRTCRGRSRLGNAREFLSISLDALLASWLGNLLAYAGLLPKLGVAGLHQEARHQPRSGEQRGVQPDHLPPAPGARVHRALRADLRGVPALHRALRAHVPPAGAPVHGDRGPLHPGRPRPHLYRRRT